MKKYILLLIIAISSLTSCRNTYQTFSAGKENESFVLIVTDNSDYTSNISLLIDNEKPILIDKVFKTKKQLQAKPITTTPGKHTIKVLQGNKVLYEQLVFLGLQETKKITLK